MTIQTFSTSPGQATNIVDATAGAEIVNLDVSGSGQSTVVVVKTDATANTVTVKAAGSTLGVLGAAGESMSFFWSGTAWTTSQNSSGSIVAPQITEIHDTAQNSRVITFSPGAATPVNWWNMAASGAGAELQLAAEGSDANISFSFVPKGTGKLTESLVAVAISSQAAQVDSTAILLATLVTDFNALLAKLRTARVLNP